MKITAITRYKHGNLYAAMKKLGWSQNELSRRCGVSAITVSRIINLKNRPSRKDADAIQRAFASVGEFFDVLLEWPETFSGLSKGFKVEQTQDVSAEVLLQNREMFMLPQEVDRNENIEKLHDMCIKNLSETERKVIDLRFNQEETLESIGCSFGLTREAVRQIQERAIQKMRTKALKRIVLEKHFNASSETQELINSATS